MKFVVTTALASLFGLPIMGLAAAPAPGSLDAARALTAEFLPMVDIGAADHFEITGAFISQGLATVNAGIPVGAKRKSCFVNLTPHTTANKYGWVVSKYYCALMSPNVEKLDGKPFTLLRKGA